MIKYLGSKRTLVLRILELVREFDEAQTVIDLFSGTSRVGHALKKAGYRVLSNDSNSYAQALATCYVQADWEDVRTRAQELIAELNALPGKAGYFTKTFCEESRFFQPKNGARIDAIRERIESDGLDAELKAVLLVSLMEAADRVDSTTGVQMAYLKKWAPRAHNNLELRLPDLASRSPHGKSMAYGMDAFDALELLHGDIAYIDPPYNHHSYLGNYHVWESLVRWDKPEVYGIACKRIDCRERTSVFNSRPKFYESMERVVMGVQSPVLIVSFNNEGFIARPEMERLLSKRGHVLVIVNEFKRYVGAQIGIYNLRGERVGEVSHLNNQEFLYVVVPHERLDLMAKLAGKYGEIGESSSLEPVGV